MDHQRRIALDGGGVGPVVVDAVAVERHRREPEQIDRAELDSLVPLPFAGRGDEIAGREVGQPAGGAVDQGLLLGQHLSPILLVAVGDVDNDHGAAAAGLLRQGLDGAAPDGRPSNDERRNLPKRT